MIRRDGDAGLSHFQLTVAGEPAALLFVAEGDINGSVLDKAVHVAYNSRIDWVTISNFASTHVLNARWLDDPSFIDLAWTDYIPRLDRLTMVSPHSIVTGQLHDDARPTADKRKVLRPIDEDLLSKLELWRRQLLSSTDPNAPSDEEVQLLIGRLLFIRSAEDRGILGKGLLSDLVHNTVSGQLHKALGDLFVRLAADFDSELFTEVAQPHAQIEDLPLREIIGRLYSPYPHLPVYSYDFSYFDIDLLGQVYERYVSTVLEPVVDVSDQLRLFDETSASVRTRSRRREEGIYYTPNYIADYVAARTVGAVASAAQSVDDLPLVGDIACGSGAFLTRAVEQLSERATELIGVPGRDMARIISTKIVGIDKDPRAVTLARVNLWTLASAGTPGKPLPSLRDRVLVQDSLLSPQLDRMEGQFDVIIGNPPFRAIGQISEAEQTAFQRRYRSALGRFDIAYLFAERALRLVRLGGLVGLVLPNRIFTNVHARGLRGFISDIADLQEVVDFGDVQAFPGATTYISLVFLRRRTHDEIGQEAAPVRVHRIAALGQYPGIQLRRAALVSTDSWESNGSSVFSAAPPSGSGPWVLSGGQVETRLRAKLLVAGIRLGDIASVPQGVKTGSNEVFLFRRVPNQDHDGLVAVTNGLGQVAHLEPELLLPFATRNAIQRYALRDTEGSDQILYPYVKGKLLPLQDIANDYPHTHAYLTAHYDRLINRATRRRGGAWWDLSWSRATGDLGNPKILSRDLVPFASFALDQFGTVIPVGGVAVIPRTVNSAPFLLLGLLNSAVVTWSLLSDTRPYRGGHRKVTPAFLRDLLVPLGALVGSQGVADRIASLAEGAARSAMFGLPTHAASEEIDSLLFSALGLSTAEADLVRGTVAAQYQQERQIAFEDQTDRLVTISRLLDEADDSLTAAQWEGTLLRVRDLLDAFLGTEHFEQSPERESIAVYALLAAQQLSERRRVDPALLVLRDIVETMKSTVVQVGAANFFLKRLASVGIDILPSIPDAGLVFREADRRDIEMIGQGRLQTRVRR